MNVMNIIRLNSLLYSAAKGKDQIMQYASATDFAIKQGFDVFGLIDTDQAIDAKTINNE